jgi:hypothetical protein
MLRRNTLVPASLIDGLFGAGVDDGEALAVEGRVRAEDEAAGVGALEFA